MRPSWLLALLALVLLPLGGGLWMSSKILRQERELVDERTEALVMDHLGEVEESILALLTRRREDIVGSLDGLDLGPESLRALERADSRLGQIVRLEEATGDLIHPPVLGILTSKEEAFLERTRGLWDRSPGLISAEDGEVRSGAWQPLFWQEGLYLIFWFPAADGTVVGVELDRVRFLADVIGALPSSDPSGDPRGLSLRLLRAGGPPLYSWGPKVEKGILPVAKRALAEPLSSWSLEAFSVSPSAGDSLERASSIQFMAVLLAAILAILGSATYLWWESRRRIREADQRVTFVNQVAHELKTPLTNIRLYAELLADRLPAAQLDSPASSPMPEPGHYAAVVVGEAQRLSRLIHNVLDFGRSRRGALSVHRQPGQIHEKLREIVDRFRPALESRGFEIDFKPEAGEPAAFDGDTLEQVVGNLLSNVEKYAAEGRFVAITSHQEGDEVVIEVRDRGPGIARAHREKIYQPFFRVNDSLTEGISGAGIGLALSRELARLHGGDLTFQPGEPGACFRLTLCCPRIIPEKESP